MLCDDVVQCEQLVSRRLSVFLSSLIRDPLMSSLLEQVILDVVRRDPASLLSRFRATVFIPNEVNLQLRVRNVGLQCNARRILEMIVGEAAARVEPRYVCGVAARCSDGRCTVIYQCRCLNDEPCFASIAGYAGRDSTENVYVDETTATAIINTGYGTAVDELVHIVREVLCAGTGAYMRIDAANTISVEYGTDLSPSINSVTAGIIAAIPGGVITANYWAQKGTVPSLVVRAALPASNREQITRMEVVWLPGQLGCIIV